jgi:hypothetical protein
MSKDRNDKSGPFAIARVGDWIITDGGRCWQISSIEDGEFGGVRIHKHLKFAWNGTHHGHSGTVTKARLATELEVAAWQAGQEDVIAARRASQAREDAAERVRDAGPQLLAALKYIADEIRANFSEVELATTETFLGDLLAKADDAIAAAETSPIKGA